MKTHPFIRITLAWAAVACAVSLAACGSSSSSGGGGSSSTGSTGGTTTPTCNTGAGTDTFTFGSSTLTDSSGGSILGSSTFCTPDILALYNGVSTAVSAQQYSTSTGALTEQWEVNLDTSTGTTGTYSVDGISVQVIFQQGSGTCGATDGSLTYTTNTAASGGSVTGSFSGVTSWSCSLISAPAATSGSFTASVD